MARLTYKYDEKIYTKKNRTSFLSIFFELLICGGQRIKRSKL